MEHDDVVRWLSQEWAEWYWSKHDNIIWWDVIWWDVTKSPPAPSLVVQREFPAITTNEARSARLYTSGSYQHQLIVVLFDGNDPHAKHHVDLDLHDPNSLQKCKKLISDWLNG